MRAAAFLVVLLLAGAPTVGANLVFDGPGVRTNLVPFVPQVHCTIAFTSGGNVYCDAEGPGMLVTHLRARVIGDATVHAVLDRVGPDGVYQQAILDCDGTKRSCSLPLADGPQYGQFKLYVYANGKPGATVVVDVEQQTGIPLP